MLPATSLKSRLHNGNVRASVLCAFKNNGKILISEGYDPVKNETFHRLLGGGIEFGERSDIALKREITEELGAEIEGLRYLGTIENIFTWEGKEGHEILLIYNAKFADEKIYNSHLLEVLDRNDAKVYWKKITDFTENKDILYPPGLLELL